MSVLRVRPQPPSPNWIDWSTTIWRGPVAESTTSVTPSLPVGILTPKPKEMFRLGLFSRAGSSSQTLAPTLMSPTPTPCETALGWVWTPAALKRAGLTLVACWNGMPTVTLLRAVKL
jgi:hypothetical protein